MGERLTPEVEREREKVTTRGEADGVASGAFHISLRGRWTVESLTRPLETENVVGESNFILTISGRPVKFRP